MPRPHGESQRNQKASDPHRAASRPGVISRSMKRAVAPILAAALLVGCQPKPQPGTKPADPVSKAQSNSGNGLEFNDPCAAQMHDISGAMLLCYALNRRLPDHLQDLATFADADQQLVFTCPVSHQPYVYVPEGLASPTSDRRLVLYDAAPVHHHTRWAILMRPAGPGQTPAAWVVQLTEPMLQLYLPTNVPPLK
jgi:hypothetical protein